MDDRRLGGIRGLIAQCNIGDGNQQHVVTRAGGAKTFIGRQSCSTQRELSDADSPKLRQVTRVDATANGFFDLSQASAAAGGKAATLDFNQHSAKLCCPIIDHRLGLKAGEESSIASLKLHLRGCLLIWCEANRGI